MGLSEILGQNIPIWFALIIAIVPSVINGITKIAEIYKDWFIFNKKLSKDKKIKDYLWLLIKEKDYLINNITQQNYLKDKKKEIINKNRERFINLLIKLSETK